MKKSWCCLDVYVRDPETPSWLVFSPNNWFRPELIGTFFSGVVSTITCKKGVSGSLIVAGDLQTPKQMTRYRDTATKDIIHCSRLYPFSKKNNLFFGGGASFQLLHLYMSRISSWLNVRNHRKNGSYVLHGEPYPTVLEHVWGVWDRYLFFLRMIQPVLGPLLNFSTAKKSWKTYKH